MRWRRVALAAMMLMPAATGTGLAAAPPPDLSSLYADAVVEGWPSGSTPVGAGIAVAGDPSVLTAAHVIAGCRRVAVSRGGVARRVALIGLDSRLDLALLADRTASPRDGPGLAAAVAAGRDATRPLRLTVAAFGQPGHDVGEPVWIEVQASGLVRGIAPKPLLSLLGELVPGTSGSPVLDGSGRLIGMVVGRRSADRLQGLAVRSAELSSFLAYFQLTAPGVGSRTLPLQGVLVQCES